jgi:hypothetical protein
MDDANDLIIKIKHIALGEAKSNNEQLIEGLT